jgi:hypothetical protein
VNSRGVAKMADAISKNPALALPEQARQWNGALPQNMYAAAPLPLLNLQPTVRYGYRPTKGKGPFGALFS